MAAAASSSSSCSRGRVLPIIASLVPFLLLLLVVTCPAALASATHGHGGGRKHAAAAAARAHQAVFRAREEREAYRRIMARMARMAKDSNMTIQVTSHLLVFHSYLLLCRCERCRLRPSKQIHLPVVYMLAAWE